MTTMGKVLLAVLVLMLTCSPAIGGNTSDIKDKDIKTIKIDVHKDTGQIVGVKLKKGIADEPGTEVPTTTPGALKGTILFHHSSPGCIVIVAGGNAWKVCW